MLSITMRQGLVDQADKFKRRIASADISNYKKVARNSLVVGFPVDEGVLGIQTRYPFAAVSPAYDVWFVQQERLDLSFFELMLRSPQARARYRQKMRGTAGRRRTLDKAEFLNIEFPLPPLPVQREIVAEIALLQGVVDGARSVLEHYRPRIPTQPDWPLVVLGDVLKTASGGTPLKANASYYEDGTIPWVKSGEVSQGMVSSAEERISRAGLDNSSAKIFPAGTVLVAMYGATAGQVGLLTIEAATNQAICGITPDPSILPAFLYYHLKGRTEELVGLSVGGAQANISQAIIRAMVIPMPPISVQKKIVAEVEAEQALVDSNRNLATLFEQKIQATLARTWGEREQAPAAS